MFGCSSFLQILNPVLNKYKYTKCPIILALSSADIAYLNQSHVGLGTTSKGKEYNMLCYPRKIKQNCFLKSNSFLWQKFIRSSIIASMQPNAFLTSSLNWSCHMQRSHIVLNLHVLLLWFSVITVYLWISFFFTIRKSPYVFVGSCFLFPNYIGNK